ncbi:MAG: His/Gly/Thr/Pro-type tRNA ligase C-terminal domain-containing protein [Gemmataceae bacterium]
MVGEKEKSSGTVAVRDRVDGDRGAKPIEELVQMLMKEVQEKRIRQVAT